MTSLAETVEDIADKIIVGDWFTSESDDGSRSFYVIGAAAYWDDVQSGGRFTTCLVAPGSKVGPLADHTVRSQVACGRAQEYLKRERKRLEHAGVSSSVIDRFISGDIDDFAALFPESMTPEDALELISPFLEALRVSRGPVQLDDEEAQDVAAAREKLCLRELARKYGKIVNRWEQLDPLPFDNPQSEEASKAYLYGFYRSSVVLSASALEGHLKRAIGSYKERSYSELVEDAAACLGMSCAWIEQAKAVFRFRNRVAHDGYAPIHDEAGEALSNTRDLLTHALSAG